MRVERANKLATLIGPAAIIMACLPLFNENTSNGLCLRPYELCGAEVARYAINGFTCFSSRTLASLANT